MPRVGDDQRPRPPYVVKQKTDHSNGSLHDLPDPRREPPNKKRRGIGKVAPCAAPMPLRPRAGRAPTSHVPGPCPDSTWDASLPAETAHRACRKVAQSGSVWAFSSICTPSDAGSSGLVIASGRRWGWAIVLTCNHEFEVEGPASDLERRTTCSGERSFRLLLPLTLSVRYNAGSHSRPKPKGSTDIPSYQWFNILRKFRRSAMGRAPGGNRTRIWCPRNESTLPCQPNLPNILC
jgi:hypothetical protein